MKISYESNGVAIFLPRWHCQTQILDIGNGSKLILSAHSLEIGLKEDIAKS